MINKNNVLIIEAHDNASSIWGISVGGSNPKHADYFGVLDYDTANRLHHLILTLCSPISGDDPVGLPSDKLGRLEC